MCPAVEATSVICIVDYACLFATHDISNSEWYLNSHGKYFEFLCSIRPIPLLAKAQKYFVCSFRAKRKCNHCGTIPTDVFIATFLEGDLQDPILFASNWSKLSVTTFGLGI